MYINSVPLLKYVLFEGQIKTYALVILSENIFTPWSSAFMMDQGDYACNFAETG